MKYLLDTCVLLWALEGDKKKLGKLTQIITDPKTIIYVSIASYWEIVIKRSLGRISIKGNLSESIEESGFMWLNIGTHHIDYLDNLPLIHNDPFDRLLIAQSKCEKIKLLTTDDKVLQYL